MLEGLIASADAQPAGLVLAGSEYRTQVLAEVLPLRDLFISLFFVSIGTLVDPPATMVNATGDNVVAMMVARVLGGKNWIKQS